MKKLECAHCYRLLERIRKASTPEDAQMWREVRMIHKKGYHPKIERTES